MKKAIKLVWMVLFALPLISLTSCGDDEPDGGISFKDYSNLLDEDRDDIINKKMKDYTPYYNDLEGVYYDNEDQDLGNNIAEVDAYFTFFEETSYGYKTYEESVMVDVELYGFSNEDLFNYLTNKYGKSEMNEDGDYQFTKGNMYIWYEYVSKNEAYVTYVDKKEFDKVKNTKADNVSVKALLKANRAAK